MPNKYPRKKGWKVPVCRELLILMINQVITKYRVARVLFCYNFGMKKLCLIFIFFNLLLKLLRPGGVRAIAAENIVLRQQLLIMGRRVKRTPRLTSTDRLLFGFWAALIPFKRLSKVAVIIKPATFLKFHQALVKRKYRSLYSSKNPKKPGPAGPDQEVIDAILAIKQHNPRFGYRRIAMQIAMAFGIPMDKDTVRRVLNKHNKNHPGKGCGPSWLTFIGHMKDSLWSLDLFRCKSIHLRTHWVMVVMDQFTRRLIGFSVGAGNLDGVATCCLFNRIIAKQTLPKYLSTDNDPLFTFHQWQANLRILEVESIKSVPYVPTSHPFIERLIGTIRREYLDHLLFWTATDLQKKLDNYLDYYNTYRGHHGLSGKAPLQQAEIATESPVISLDSYQWQSHGNGLFKLPKAA